MKHLTEERRIKACLEKVWEVAGDFTKSPDSSLPITIVKKGDNSNFGIGCERKIKSGRAMIHERLEAVDPLKSITYRMLSGAPLKYYLGKVELFKENDITLVKWSVEFIPKYFGTGWITNRVINNNLLRFLDELEKIK